ncbi:MAG TPA: 50S ribosomal protein L15 [Firmicutes bacterium]|nr:50S ribosomal protein L15 [Bacillota bacterium]
MQIHDLKPNPGARKKAKRVGRGIGSGLGKTSTRGHKGQKARSGGAKGPGFEGGQMPLQRRLPKRGFTNTFGTEYTVVNLDRLDAVFEANTEVTPELLLETGVIKKIGDGVKVLGKGEVTKPFVVKAHRFSKSAVEKIEAAGGKAQVI